MKGMSKSKKGNKILKEVVSAVIAAGLAFFVFVVLNFV